MKSTGKKVEIKLLKDIQYENNYAIEINRNATYTLDLNGYTISVGQPVSVFLWIKSGTVILQDSSLDKDGCIRLEGDPNSDYCVIVDGENASFIFRSGKILDFWVGIWHWKGKVEVTGESYIKSTTIADDMGWGIIQGDGELSVSGNATIYGRYNGINGADKGLVISGNPHISGEYGLYIGGNGDRCCL